VGPLGLTLPRPVILSMRTSSAMVSQGRPETHSDMRTAGGQLPAAGVAVLACCADVCQWRSG
jgi:hypothetical protein